MMNTIGYIIGILGIIGIFIYMIGAFGSDSFKQALKNLAIAAVFTLFAIAGALMIMKFPG